MKNQVKKSKNSIIFFSFIWILSITACNEKPDKSVEYVAEEIKQPNILFLFSDDQRENTIAALGNKEVITPNIDKLVEEGTSFTNNYLMGAMNGAVCSPSRAMLMTGRALFNIDPTGNTIDSTHTTMPKALGNAGYQTFHIGKWHNGRDAFTRSFNDGSKIFFGGMHSQYNVPTYEFNSGKNYSKENLNEASPKHSSELYADAGIAFLENYKSDDPFFLYMAFQAPHDPREMPEEYLKMYDTTNIAVPPNFLTEHPFDNGELDIRDEWLAGYPRTKAEVKANIQAYYAMITHLDAQIGRILKTLKDKGFMENTIIVYSSDNGLSIGSHGLMGKQNLYEESVNVPLIFKGPGVPKGKITNSFSYLFDIYPTLCDFANADIPKTVEGKSLKPIIEGKVNRVRDTVFFAYKNFQRAARNDRWKIIKYNVNNKITTQLFDLKNDPYEITNLADDPKYKDVLADMNDLLDQEMIKYNDKADLNKDGWGVPVIQAWKDKVSKEELDHLRGLAKKERQMRGFGFD